MQVFGLVITGLSSGLGVSLGVILMIRALLGIKGVMGYELLVFENIENSGNWRVLIMINEIGEILIFPLGAFRNPY